MYQLKIKKRAYALRAIRKRGISQDCIRQLEKCSSITALRTEKSAHDARRKLTCKTQFTTWPADKGMPTRGREHWISPSKSTFVSSRPSAGLVTIGSRRIPRTLLREGGPSAGRALFHPHFRVKMSAIYSRKPTRKSHLQLWKNGENDNGGWGINFHRSSANTDAVAKHSAGYLDFLNMGRDNVEKFVAGCDPADEKKIVHISDKYFTYINNGPNPVELKLPDGHSFTMPPGMSMMVPPPIEKTFYTHEDYHYGMKRRYIFPFAGQWWHMREQGEPVSDSIPIKMDFKSYRSISYRSIDNFPRKSFSKEWLDRVKSYMEKESQLLAKSLGIELDPDLKPTDDELECSLREIYKPISDFRSFAPTQSDPNLNWTNVIDSETYKLLEQSWNDFRYRTREAMFKINRRPSHFTGMYGEAYDEVFRARVVDNGDGTFGVTEDPNGQFEVHTHVGPTSTFQTTGCPYCGISDGPGNCTEQANCLNVSMEAERKMINRQMKADQIAFNLIENVIEEALEQKRRDSTVEGFRGYKDPKYKPKKR